MSDIIKNNWSLLKSRWPEIHCLVESSLTPENVVLDDRYDEHTYIVDGIHLSSTRSSEKEACQQAETIPPESEYVCCYGIGMGDLPRALLKRKALKQLDVYLFNFGIFKLLLETTDQTTWLSDQRVKLFSAAGSTQVKSPYTATPACLYLATKETWPLRDRVQLELNSRFTNKQFRNRKLVSENIKANRKVIAETPGVDTLKNGFTKQTISVVGAGPSLDDNLDQLRESEHIICVDRVLHLLLENDIVPDYVTTADPGDILCKYNDFSQHDLSNVTLVYVPAAEYKAIAQWPGKKFVALSTSPIYDDFRQSHPDALLYLSGSVIHMSIDLAVLLGANNIDLYGTDFCFLDNKTHAGQQLQDTDNPPYFNTEVLCWNGNEQKTTYNLKGYLTELEDYISVHNEIHFICVSDRGAKIQGTSLAGTIK